jgi:hypothetical protein
MNGRTSVQSESVAGDRAESRVLAIADTDSYLKWSVATLEALPSSWQSTQLIIENPAMPSAAQIRAISSRHIEVLPTAEVVRRIRLKCPDVVLLACTGPVVAALTVRRVFRGRTRPVLVTGLPGISVPANSRAVRSRSACDLFLLHSKREVAEFSEIGARRAAGLIFGLAPLPFLPARTSEALTDVQLGPNLVFAAQAKVPVERTDREQILLALADAGSAVVKLRAWSEEQQTHNETWSYPHIMGDLVAQRRLSADAVTFVGGSMQEVLRTSRGFATVSSTAALEAMAMNRPTLIISDFGVSAEMINLVFEESGCLGTLADLRSGRLCQADPLWLEANYFHPAGDNNWLELLNQLLEVRAAGQLATLPRWRGSLRGRMRRRLRLMIPAALWPHIRRLRGVLSPSRKWTSFPAGLVSSHTVRNEGDSAELRLVSDRVRSNSE